MKSTSTDSSSELDKASQWTRNYRDKNPGALKGHCIKKEQLEAILRQPGCEGIRAYYGLDEADNRKLVFVGIDANEQDIISETGFVSALRAAAPDDDTATDAAQPTIVTETQPCPPCCSLDNPLNS